MIIKAIPTLKERFTSGLDVGREQGQNLAFSHGVQKNKLLLVEFGCRDMGAKSYLPKKIWYLRVSLLRTVIYYGIENRKIKLYEDQKR